MIKKTGAPDCSGEFHRRDRHRRRKPRHNPGQNSRGTRRQGRWRAQQIVALKAEANYRNARLAREVAEIAVIEYEEGIFKQDLATVKARSSSPSLTWSVRRIG